ncbi:hypothetical protein QAD02_021227 [Eretmocerus hayati]|uniref:Uncharacterized protein n=1 Tax=Eretmocerus hayati TaxID=131215 RepID=A0ACC2PPB3_9HYME|nr:hypothetical protein QAD02_021227 [Eretmocerus hayati]
MHYRNKASQRLQSGLAEDIVRLLNKEGSVTIYYEGGYTTPEGREKPDGFCGRAWEYYRDFIVYSKNHMKLDAVLKTVRNEQIDRYGGKWPYIIYCSELQNSTCFHAVYPGKTHDLNLAVDAIDFLSKFFLVTDYDWPPACGQVWSFLMKRGYGILDKGKRQASPAHQ